MPNTWFTADTHFNHKNIIEYDRLPFKDVVEMNDAITERWNAVVAAEDSVYHLGDVGFGDFERWFNALNGRKFLIRGNHDRGRTQFWNRKFGWVKEDYLWADDGLALYLSHKRSLTWPGQENGVIHLHGHSHGNAPPVAGTLDVGSKVWNHYPLSVNALRSYWPNPTIP